MSCSFSGGHNVRTDAKARLSVPAAFRRKLEEVGDQRLVLIPDVQPAVRAYPMAAWLAWVEKIAALPQGDPVVQRIKKVQFAMASEVTCDSHGRVLLTPELRRHAGIDVTDEVKIIGQIKYFELWRAAHWQQVFDEAYESQPGDVTAWKDFGV